MHIYNKNLRRNVEMQPGFKKKERFEKAMSKALEEGKCDYLRITAGVSRAILDASEFANIKNAFVIIRDADSIKKWVIEEYQVKECSDELHICIKGSRVLLGCVGDHNKESSFFEFRGESDDSENKIIIFGAVEIMECSCAFYFNGIDKQRIAIYSYADGQYGNELYCLVNGLLRIEEGVHEGTDDNKKGLSWENDSATDELWVG